jgi:O-antigen/teichoic acid export membrane protein
LKPISLKTNVFANYAGFVYLAVIGVVMVPIYISRMGVEAYGLVSFYVVLQTFFLLLDLGVTPAMTREAAQYRGDATSALSLRQLLRTFELVFGTLAAGGALAVIAASGWIAASWLQVQSLPLGEIESSLALMAAVAALRWITGLYRGVIAGLEHQAWLAGFGAVTSTASFVLVVPVLDFAGRTVFVFFAHQASVALFELAVMCWKAYRLIPPSSSPVRLLPAFGPVRGVLKFALSVAFVSSVWFAVNNLDKLVLSKLLPLTDYAHFSIAVLVAGTIVVISGPISTALMPRLASLNADGDDAGFVGLYRNATQAIAIAVFPPCLLMALFAEEIVWIWTGQREIASQAWPILTIYAVANGILAMSACAYFMQFGKGDLRLHVYGNVIFAVTLIPSMIWASVRFGPMGAGTAWLVSNALYFALWVPLVHRRFVPGLHRKWLLNDIAPVLVPVLMGAAVLRAFVQVPDGRISGGVALALAGMALVMLALSGSSMARRALINRYRPPVETQ